MKTKFTSFTDGDEIGVLKKSGFLSKERSFTPSTTRRVSYQSQRKVIPSQIGSVGLHISLLAGDKPKFPRVYKTIPRQTGTKMINIYFQNEAHRVPSKENERNSPNFDNEA